MTKHCILSLIACCASLSLCLSCRQETSREAVLGVLHHQAEQRVPLLGHQDALMYGHEWNSKASESCDFDRSDIKDVCGAHPYLLGLDLGGIETGSSCNLDGNNFESMRQAAIAHHERSGLVTLSWHPRNPKTGGSAWDVSDAGTVASILPSGDHHQAFLGWLDRVSDFILSLKDSKGKPIPVIWRPWHEHTGSWFWWGQDLCTTQEYLQLWEMTYDYMVNRKGLDYLIWAYSPGAGGLTPELFAERYPGDAFVDVVGFDCYQYGSNQSYADDMRKALDIVSAFAADHGKVLAVTETGYESLPYPNWWTEVLGPVLKDYPVAYVLLWRNASEMPLKEKHFYAPWPGGPSETDFVKYIESESVKLL